MSKALKSSASSRRAPLKSTSAAATKAEKIVRYTVDPETVRELEDGKRQRLAALEQQVAGNDDGGNAPVGAMKISPGRRLRGAFYPPVEIDAGIVEWFMKRTGNRMTMALDINDALKSHIAAIEKAERKKAG